MTVVLLLGANGFLGRSIRGEIDATPGLDLVPWAGPHAGNARAPGQYGMDLASVPVPELARAIEASGPEVIVNAAGRTTGSTGGLVEADLLVVANLLEAVGRLPFRPRLLQLGSAAEYGRATGNRRARETDRAEPVGPYGILKLAATDLVLAARRKGTVQGTVLRVFNPLGPGLPPGSLGRAALDALGAAVQDGSGSIRLGPLGAVRDFVDTRDVARAVVAACLAPALEAPIVNVATGRGHTARELVAELASRLGYRGRIEEDGPGSPRSESVPWLVADISVARRLLGWAPLHDLAAACDHLISGSS